MSAIIIHPAGPNELTSLLPSSSPAPSSSSTSTRTRHTTSTSKILDRSAPLKDSISTTRFVIICIGIWSANFVFAFQASAIPTLAPTISSGFNHAELGSYLGSIFTLSSSAGESVGPNFHFVLSSFSLVANGFPWDGKILRVRREKAERN